MNMVIYLKILKTEVTNWPKSWVLKEDRALDHGRGKDSMITRWKKANNVSYYFNYPYSPNLAPIENCWVAPKATLQKFGHWTEEEVQNLSCEGWHNLKQKKIDAWCDSMPQRLRDVIAAEGQMTAW